MMATKTQRVGMEDCHMSELFLQFQLAYSAMCDLATTLANVENQGYKVRGDCEDESDVLFKAARALTAYEDVREFHLMED
jgi:Ser/Thr protein kinase RdoA (MazF antagonist)